MPDKETEYEIKLNNTLKQLNNKKDTLANLRMNIGGIEADVERLKKEKIELESYAEKENKDKSELNKLQENMDIVTDVAEYKSFFKRKKEGDDIKEEEWDQVKEIIDNSDKTIKKLNSKLDKHEKAIKKEADEYDPQEKAFQKTQTFQINSIKELKESALELHSMRGELQTYEKQIKAAYKEGVIKEEEKLKVAYYLLEMERIIKVIEGDKKNNRKIFDNLNAIDMKSKQIKNNELNKNHSKAEKDNEDTKANILKELGEAKEKRKKIY